MSNRRQVRAGSGSTSSRASSERPPVTFVASEWAAPGDAGRPGPQVLAHDRWWAAWDAWFDAEGVESVALRLMLRRGRQLSLTEHGYAVVTRRRAELGLTGLPEGLTPPQAQP